MRYIAFYISFAVLLWLSLQAGRAVVPIAGF